VAIGSTRANPTAGGHDQIELGAWLGFLLFVRDVVEGEAARHLVLVVLVFLGFDGGIWTHLFLAVRHVGEADAGC